MTLASVTGELGRCPLSRRQKWLRDRPVVGARSMFIADAVNCHLGGKSAVDYGHSVHEHEDANSVIEGRSIFTAGIFSGILNPDESRGSVRKRASHIRRDSGQRINYSRIHTVIVCAHHFEPGASRTEPGNVLLDLGEGGSATKRCGRFASVVGPTRGQLGVGSTWVRCQKSASRRSCWYAIPAGVVFRRAITVRRQGVDTVRDASSLRRVAASFRHMVPGRAHVDGGGIFMARAFSKAGRASSSAIHRSTLG